MNIFGLEIKKQLKMSATQSSSQVKPEQKKVYAAERQVGGYLEDQYEASSSLSLDDLLAMRKDPTIKIALWFYSTIILSGFGDYTHPDEEVQKFIRENMERINLKRKLTKMLSFRWIGASVSEIVWDYIDGKYQVTDLVYLKPETWYDNGLPLSEVDPIKQVGKDSVKIEIPQNKCIILRNFGDHQTDNSILDGDVKKYWSSKNKNYTSWTESLDEYAKPKTEITYSQGSGLYGPDGTPLDEDKEAKVYADKAEAFRKATSFAHDNEINVDYKEPPKDIGTHFIEKLKYDDRMILRSMFLPALIIQGNDGGVGSNATATTHYEFFWDYLQSEMNVLSREFITQLVRLLIQYNFPNVKDYGRFNVDDVKVKDYDSWCNIILKLTNMGVLAPSVNRQHRKFVLDFFNMLDGKIDIDQMLDNSIIPQDEFEK